MPMSMTRDPLDMTAIRHHRVFRDNDHAVADVVTIAVLIGLSLVGGNDDVVADARVFIEDRAGDMAFGANSAGG